MHEGKLSDWKEDYMTGTQSYPVTARQEFILPLLRLPFTRATILRDPEFQIDPSQISVKHNKEMASKYWADPTEERGRKASGKTIHYANITEEVIQNESSEAGIVLSSDAVQNMTEKCNKLRQMFTEVYNGYTDRAFKSMRGFTLFTPIGGQGRSPELHIDNTILTLHWAAALATFRVHDGLLDDKVWEALDMRRRKQKAPEEQSKDFSFLVDQARILDMTENQVGDVCFTKGQLGRDLGDKNARQSVCVHVSSPTIHQFGQAGFLMTPEMPK